MNILAAIFIALFGALALAVISIGLNMIYKEMENEIESRNNENKDK